MRVIIVYTGSMKDWKMLEKELMQNPVLKAEFDRHEPEYQSARKLIEVRRQGNLTEEQAWRASLPKKHIAVKVIARDLEGRVLLVKPKYREYWHIPGGGVDESEGVIEAALRELKEETNVSATADELTLVDVIYRPQHDELNVVYELMTRVSSKQIVMQESEIEAFEFVAPERAESYLSQGMREWWRGWISR